MIVRRFIRIIKTSAFLMVGLAAAISCRKIEQLPDEPFIEFTSFSVFDTILLRDDCKAGKLKFYFEDGNGDLGLEEPPTGSIAPGSNLFFTLFRKTGGIMTQITDSSDLMMPSNYRIPYLERLGQNKILKGTIAVTFVYTFYNPVDSGIYRYDFYIKDRAENSSDTISTCNIPLSENGIYIN